MVRCYQFNTYSTHSRIWHRHCVNVRWLWSNPIDRTVFECQRPLVGTHLSSHHNAPWCCSTSLDPIRLDRIWHLENVLQNAPHADPCPMTLQAISMLPHFDPLSKIDAPIWADSFDPPMDFSNAYIVFRFAHRKRKKKSGNENKKEWETRKQKYLGEKRFWLYAYVFANNFICNWFEFNIWVLTSCLCLDCRRNENISACYVNAAAGALLSVVW